MQYTSSETPFLPVRNNLQSSHTLRGTPAGTLGAAGTHPLNGLRGGFGAGTRVSGPGSLRNARFSEKNLAGRCSWRCVAIFFVVLAVILSAALAYITGEFNLHFKKKKFLKRQSTDLSPFSTRHEFFSVFSFAW